MSREIEFGQKPFIAGTFVGIRSFRVDGLRLTGCVRRQPWVAGLNEAACMTRDPMTMVYYQHMLVAPHRAGTLTCSCGFYAYFDLNANLHHQPTNALGIVEGFGSVTAGSRGFRAEKARIVALIDAPAPVVVDCPCSKCTNAERPDVAAIAERYGVPMFPTVAAAVAEFPLTPVEVPITDSDDRLAGSVTMTFNAHQMAAAFESAMKQLALSLQQSSASVARMKVELEALCAPRIESAPTESRAQRALRLRRERNTGPAQTTGIDGRKRS